MSRLRASLTPVTTGAVSSGSVTTSKVPKSQVKQLQGALPLLLDDVGQRLVAAQLHDDVHVRRVLEAPPVMVLTLVHMFNST